MKKMQKLLIDSSSETSTSNILVHLGLPYTSENVHGYEGGGWCLFAFCKIEQIIHAISLPFLSTSNTVSYKEIYN